MKTKMNKTTTLKSLTFTAMFLAMGIILPFLFGQIPQIGSMLLPMHIPVFLCAFICGWKYGVPMAIILPLLRSFLFLRPNLYPEAISIACEMAVYAFVAGYLYQKSKWKCIKALYKSMIIAMISGRIVRVAVQLALLGLGSMPFTFGAVITGVLVIGIPGIILQLIVIPAVMVMLHRTKLIPLFSTKTLHLKEK